MNGKDLAELKGFCEKNRTKLDLIMKVLHLAGFDNRVIDYLSSGEWTLRQAAIGLDLSEMYPAK